MDSSEISQGSSVPTETETSAAREVWKSISIPQMIQGDRLTLTIGQETFVSGKFGGSFTVGPVSVDIQAQDGESLEDVQVRLRKIASLTWETEFELKLKQYVERALQVREKLG